MPSSKRQEPFWLGGAAASMAVCFTHPLDQVKYRMQVLKLKENMFHALSRFAARDGIPSLWQGLSASILRQSTYSTARFGLFAALTDAAAAPLPMPCTILCAGVAGGVAGVVGNPIEVVLVRMCADGARTAPGERFAYGNAVAGLARVAREEGVRTFGRGLGPNVARSVLMNVGQMAPYAVTKQHLLRHLGWRDNVVTHTLASSVAGTVATTICAPADVLKSRMQSATGRMIVRTGLHEEGPRFLMKGWTPAWLRLTPHTVLTFVFMEQLRKVTSIRLAVPEQKTIEA